MTAFIFCGKGGGILYELFNPTQNNKGCCAYAQQPLLFHYIPWTLGLLATLVIITYYADKLTLITLIALLN